MNTDFFTRLRDGAGPVWTDYTRHAFVRGMADGSLPQPAFRHYLEQDYLFLLQFIRAYGLAAYKSSTLEDMQAAADGIAAILAEMPLHVRFCAGWGLTEAQMTAAPEAVETVAYTRFVLDCGTGGDLLDLQVAMAPCVMGYADIGRELAPFATQGNPYAPWIEMYAGAEYQAAAASAAAALDRLAARSGGEARLATLQARFNTGTRMEAAFWQMGLNAA